MLCPSPASLLEGIKEVRSPGRTKGRQQRWRDGTLGISRKGIKDVCAAKLPRPFGEGVRGRGPFERLRIFGELLCNAFPQKTPLLLRISKKFRTFVAVFLSIQSRKRLENDTKTTRFNKHKNKS